MKLNNKGFAITGILYGLLILFAIMVASYLTILVARKNRLDSIISDNEEEYYSIIEKENNTYTLTLNKGSGISKIYYKVSTEGSYSSSSSSVTINKIAPGTVYYYYVEPSSGYEAMTCNSKINYCEATVTENKNILLSARQKDTHIVRIYRVINTTDLLYAKPIIDGDNVTYSFAKPSNTYSSSYCNPTHGITVYNNTKTNMTEVTINNIKSDLNCYIVFTNDNGNVLA